MLIIEKGYNNTLILYGENSSPLFTYLLEISLTPLYVHVWMNIYSILNNWICQAKNSGWVRQRRGTTSCTDTHILSGSLRVACVLICPTKHSTARLHSGRLISQHNTLFWHANTYLHYDKDTWFNIRLFKCLAKGVSLVQLTPLYTPFRVEHALGVDLNRPMSVI